MASGDGILRTSTTETHTGYVLESIALEVDTISLPLRQTYGHNHTY